MIQLVVVSHNTLIVRDICTDVNISITLEVKSFILLNDPMNVELLSQLGNWQNKSMEI